MSRLTLWNLYHNQPSPPEPQKEPINLEKREDPVGPPPAKRHLPDAEDIKMTGTHIKISSRSMLKFIYYLKYFEIQMNYSTLLDNNLTSQGKIYCTCVFFSLGL